MAKTWTAPVLEELSIPAGTYGSTDDAGSTSPDFGSSPDLGSTAS